MLCTNSFSTLAWHLPQVAGTLNLAIGDSGSVPVRISCAPWQSVQTAACSDPPLTALPWTLCSYELKGAELTPLPAITSSLPWQEPQVAGMLTCATFDFGSLAGSTSWTLPWQSWHLATLALPAAAALAWMPCS